jgi:hypothetical protein
MPLDAGDDDWGGGDCPNCCGSGRIYDAIPMVCAYWRGPIDGVYIVSRNCLVCYPQGGSCKTCAGTGSYSFVIRTICNGEMISHMRASCGCQPCIKNMEKMP